MAFRFFETETGATALVHKEVADEFPSFINPVTEDQLSQLRDAERKFKERATCVEAVMVATDGRQIES